MTFAHRISAYNRSRKWGLFLEEIAPTRATRVLDVGFSEEEYSSNDNFIEKHYPHPEMLTALGIDTPVKFKRRYPEVATVRYDGSVFPFSDQAFDVLWSNAVIEHVGDRSKQLFFLKEIKRVSKKAFITTPNRFFPVEVHTCTPLLHYLPESIFDRYVTLIGKRWATSEYIRLLSHSELEALLADADIAEYRIIKNMLVRLPLDFVVLF